MYSKMPTKPKKCIFFRFGLPTIRRRYNYKKCDARTPKRTVDDWPTFVQNYIRNFLKKAKGSWDIQQWCETLQAYRINIKEAFRVFALLFPWKSISLFPCSPKLKENVFLCALFLTIVFVTRLPSYFGLCSSVLFPFPRTPVSKTGQLLVRMVPSNS